MSRKMRLDIPGLCVSHSADDSPHPGLNMRHCHDHYEILYVVQGSGRYIVEGAEYTMRPRTLIVIPPLNYHCVEVCEGGTYDRYVLQLWESGLPAEVLPMLRAIAGERGTLYATDALSDFPVSVFEQLEYAAGLAGEEQAILVRLLAAQLVVLLSACGAEREQPQEEELGARVIRYLNDHLDRDVGLDALAKHFFVSKYYLCRAFKKHNGISVHGYINQKRVMYAKQLIESGETAASAAYQVGFGDYSAFYRAYVKLLGTAPTASVERKENKG